MAGEVLALMRAGVPGEEIVVVHRSVARAAPLVSRVFEQYGIALASRYELPFAHTALGRAVLGLARCALSGGRGARPEDLLDYLRAPGLLERPEIADGLEATIRREGLSTAAEARERFGWELEEIDALASAEHPATELRRHARRLFAAPHRRRAPTLTREEELDARALGVLLGGLDELDELGQRLSGAELIEVLEGLTVTAGAPASPGRGAARGAARDQGPAIPGGVRLRAPGGRVPDRIAARAVPVRRAPARARGVLGASPAPARGQPCAASAICSTPASPAPPSRS